MELGNEAMTHLQQVHTLRLHAVDSLTDGLLYDLSGNFYRSKYAPLCCANDFDRRCDIADSSTLTTVKNGRGKKKMMGRREGRENGSVRNDPER